MKLTRRKFFRGLLAVPVGAGAAVVAAKLPVPTETKSMILARWNKTGPLATIYTGLPAPTWRKLYEGGLPDRTSETLARTNEIMEELPWEEPK